MRSGFARSGPVRECRIQGDGAARPSWWDPSLAEGTSSTWSARITPCVSDGLRRTTRTGTDSGRHSGRHSGRASDTGVPSGVVGGAYRGRWKNVSERFVPYGRGGDRTRRDLYILKPGERRPPRRRLLGHRLQPGTDAGGSRHRRLRYRGVGPAGLRVGRHVRYRRADVDCWLAGRADTTSETGGGR